MHHWGSQYSASTKPMLTNAALRAVWVAIRNWSALRFAILIPIFKELIAVFDLWRRRAENTWASESAPILLMSLSAAQGSEPNYLPPTGHSERRKVRVFVAIWQMNVHVGCVVGPYP
jgi:hypothetical protein